MANKIIGFTIKIDGTSETINKLSKVNLEVAKLTPELAKLKRSVKDAISKGDSAAAEEYQRELDRVTLAQKELKAQSALLNKEIRNQNKAFEESKAAQGSYRALNAEVVALRNSFKSLSKEEREGQVGQDLTAQINKLDLELKDLDSSIGLFQRNVGDYENSIVRALKRAGQEEQLQKMFGELSVQSDKLQGKVKELGKEYELALEGKGVRSLKEIQEELVKTNKELDKTEKNAKEVGAALSETANNKGGAGVSGRQAGRTAKVIGKLSGLNDATGGAFGVAGGLGEAADVAGRFGAAGLAAFGIFAAGGLVFKAISALSDLTTKFQKLEGEVASFSGLSGQELKIVASDVQALATTFDVTTTDINKAAKEVSENLGISFTDALTKVEAGLVAGQVDNAEFLSIIQEFPAAIDKVTGASSALSAKNKELLGANKDLTAAQSDLAATFESSGINFEAAGTRIKASLLNAANSVLNFFDRTFGDGIGSAKQDLREATRALADQKTVVNDLQKNYTPLLDRYDALQAELKKVNPESQRAKEIQAELGTVIKQIGDRMPSVITQFDDYGNAIAINSDKARGFVSKNVAVLKNLESAQTSQALTTLSLLKTQRDELEKNILTGEAAFGALGTIKLDDKQIANAGAELQKLGGDIKEIETLLKSSNLGAYNLRIVELGGGLTGTISAFKESINNTIKSEQATEGLAKATILDADALKAQKEAILDAAKTAKDVRDKLIEQEKASREAYIQAVADTGKAIESQRIENIDNDFQREIAALDNNTKLRIENETKSLQDAGDARVATLKEIQSKVGFDSVLRAQFGSKEDIDKQIQAVNSEVIVKIQDQTTLINQARDKQRADLEQKRLAANKAALDLLTTNELERAIEATQQKLSTLDLSKQQLEIGLTLNETKLQQSFDNASKKLEAVRNFGLITESEYQSELLNLESERQKQALALTQDRAAKEQVLNDQQLQATNDLLAKELTLRVNELNTETAAKVAAIQAEAAQGNLAQEQANAEILAIQQTNDQNILAEQQATLDQQNVNTQDAAAQTIEVQGDLANSELQLFVDTQAKIREQRQITLDQINQGAQQFAQVYGQIATVITDVFTASDNLQKQKINEKYANELALAQGNQAQIAAIEKRKDAELAKIQKEAAARQRGLAIAQAVINGALAVTNILATTPDPTGIFTAIRIAAAVAVTGAQIALIASQSFADGGMLPSGDGEIQGRSHSQGGIKFMHNGHPVEVEGGEWLATDEFGKKVVINRANTSQFRDVLRSMRGQSFVGKRAALSSINSFGGRGVSFAFGGGLPQSAPIQAPNLNNGNAASDLSNAFLGFAAMNEMRLNELESYTTAVRNQQLNMRVINDPEQTVRIGSGLVVKTENLGL